MLRPLASADVLGRLLGERGLQSASSVHINRKPSPMPNGSSVPSTSEVPISAKGASLPALPHGPTRQLTPRRTASFQELCKPCEQPTCGLASTDLCVSLNPQESRSIVPFAGEWGMEPWSDGLR